MVSCLDDKTDFVLQDHLRGGVGQLSNQRGLTGPGVGWHGRDSRYLSQKVEDVLVSAVVVIRITALVQVFDDVAAGQQKEEEEEPEVAQFLGWGGGHLRPALSVGVRSAKHGSGGREPSCDPVFDVRLQLGDVLSRLLGTENRTQAPGKRLAKALTVPIVSVRRMSTTSVMVDGGA